MSDVLSCLQRRISSRFTPPKFYCVKPKLLPWFHNFRYWICAVSGHSEALVSFALSMVTYGLYFHQIPPKKAPRGVNASSVPLCQLRAGHGRTVDNRSKIKPADDRLPHQNFFETWTSEVGASPFSFLCLWRFGSSTSSLKSCIVKADLLLLIFLEKDVLPGLEMRTRQVQNPPSGQG